jgi:hypothetical protein
MSDERLTTSNSFSNSEEQTMSNMIEPEVEEPSGGGGPNRLFIILALSLAGLLVLGLLGVSIYLVYTRFIAPPASGSPTPTRPPAVITATTTVVGTPAPVATDTPGGATPTPTSVLSGRTPVPTITGTLPSVPGATGTPAPSPTSGVVPIATNTPTPGGGAAATSAPARTNTPSSETPGTGGGGTPPTSDGGTLPTTGLETDLAIIGALMVLLLLIARGLRSAFSR